MIRIGVSIWVLALAIGIANAQAPSVLRRDGLNGPVRAIRLEFQDYDWEDSRWKPSGELLSHVERYDRNGRRLTSNIDPGSGWRAYGLPLPPATAPRSGRYEIVRKRGRSGMGWKTVWLFDQERRLERFESWALYESGPALATWQQFSYDSQGRVETLTYWADWGRGPNQTEPYPPVLVKYWFDDEGRIGGWTESGNRNSRSTLTYDNAGRVVKLFEEQFDGNITYLTTETRDGYDRHGNWTVRTYTQAWRTEDGDDPNSQTVFRRSITYGREVKSR